MNVLTVFCSTVIGLSIGGHLAHHLGVPTLQRLFAVAILGVGLLVIVRNLAL